MLRRIMENLDKSKVYDVRSLNDEQRIELTLFLNKDRDIWNYTDLKKINYVLFIDNYWYSSGAPIKEEAINI